MSIVSFKQLEKRYGKKTALYPSDASFGVGIHAILGPNGAGKSTMMKLLCGIMRPSGGTVCFDGQKIGALGAAYRKKLAILFQKQPMYPYYTGAEYLQFMGLLKGLSAPEIAQQAALLLRRTGLTDSARRRIATFSGGMRQRLAIAGTLLGDPEILILDEPSVGLDPQEREELKQVLSSFRKEKIVLISTHIVPDVDHICDSVLLMQEGKILSCGTVPELIAPLRHQIWLIPDSEQSLLQNDAYYYVNGSLRSRAETPPTPHSQPAEATLEDLYFCTVQPHAWGDRS